MNNKSKGKVLFIREEFADGEGEFLYPDRSKYEGNFYEGKI